MPRFQALFAAFPDQAMVIRRTILRDSDFASVCEDYLSCLAAIEHWQHLADPNARVEEYRRALTELTDEIVSHLARNPEVKIRAKSQLAPPVSHIDASPEPPTNMEKN